MDDFTFVFCCFLPSQEDIGFFINVGFGCQGGNSAWNYFERSGVVTGGDYTDVGSDELNGDKYREIKGKWN